MKKLLISLMLVLTTLAMVGDALARPLGGGRTFGRQSQSVSRQAAPAPSQAQRQAAAPAPAAPMAAPVKPPSPWKGILGGALLGLGMGALLSHFGMGGALGGMLGSLLMIGLLALAALFVYRMLRRKDTPANSQFTSTTNPAFAQQPAGGGLPEIGSGLRTPAASGAPGAAAPWGVPADFDSAAFLRQAKSSFIRLQAAWDKADVNDLREFTTPEVFAELKLQIQERGAVADFTDVVSIEGRLLGIETSGNDYLASVQFDGLIKSAPDASAEPFVEVWNMSKPLSGSSGWVLAGIEQVR